MDRYIEKLDTVWASLSSIDYGSLKNIGYFFFFLLVVHTAGIFYRNLRSQAEGL